MLQEGYQFFKGTPKLRWVGIFGSKTLKRRLRAALKWPVLPYPKRQQAASVPPQPVGLASSVAAVSG
jgi:hypothetical protein